MSISSSIPQLPASVPQWSTRGLAAHLGVSVSTVKYHARQVFRRRQEQGRWVFNLEQAQRVTNHIYQFGQKDTLNHCVSPAQIKTLSES